MPFTTKAIVFTHTVSETDYSQTIAFNSIGYTGSAASATVRTTGKSGTDNFQLILAEGGNDILEVDCNRLENHGQYFMTLKCHYKTPWLVVFENGATINTEAHCISDIIEPIDVKSSPKSIPLNNSSIGILKPLRPLADLASMGIVSNTHVYTGAYTTAESESILMPLVKGARVASSSYANGIDKGRVLPFIMSIALALLWSQYVFFWQSNSRLHRHQGRSIYRYNRPSRR